MEISDINKRNEWLFSKHLVQGVDRCKSCKVEINGEYPSGVQWIQCVYGKSHEGLHSFEDQENIDNDCRLIKDIPT